eukprot:GAHX01008218.1.p1 GENE.GAHX01008218.1~~GAHX01008218.1.p1  ORF type:complete len:55 (-),score=5.29 GAHX01008218.1:43-207(-)
MEISQQNYYPKTEVDMKQIINYAYSHECLCIQIKHQTFVIKISSLQIVRYQDPI